jgi:hypothetical protein
MPRKRTPPSKLDVSGADMGRQDDSTVSANAEPNPPTIAPIDAQARARAREADRRDAELAMREYQQERETIQKRTARLRAQRLARETSKPPKKPKL